MFEDIFENIDKRKILILVSIILLIIAVYFIFLKKEEVEPPMPSEPADYRFRLAKECEQKETEEEKQICFDRIDLIEIIKEKDIKKCLNLKTLSVRNDCLLNLAANVFLNDDFCLAISDEAKRAVCIDRISITKKDTKICEKHFDGEPFELQECKDRILAFKISESGKKEDIVECKNIETLEYPNLCLQNSFKNKFSNNCIEVPAEFRDYCMAVNIIQYASKPEDCSLVNLKDYKDFCLRKVELNDMREAAKIDSDNDGFTDGNELFTQTDPNNPDSDGDGLLDGEDMFTYRTNPKNPDTDSDGLTDYEEVKIYNTNPNKPDTDGDGILDGEEIKNGTDPHTGDSDKDGLADVDEMKFGTDPNNPDSDSDGYSDEKEVKYGYNPLGEGLADTDSDGLLDIDEIFYGTDRLNPDTDGDGVSDKKEVDQLTNPLGPGDMDFDNDGLTDKEEEKYGTNPSLSDTDGDGVNDGREIGLGTNPNKIDH